MATLQERLTAVVQAIGADISPLTKRLIIQTTATAKAWVIRRFSAGATGNLLEFQDETTTAMLVVNAAGEIVGTVPGLGTVTLRPVNSFLGELAWQVGRINISDGRFDIIQQAETAEMRVLNGGVNTRFRVFNLGSDTALIDAGGTTLKVPGTFTLGDGTIQTTAFGPYSALMNGVAPGLVTGDYFDSSLAKPTQANVAFATGTTWAFPIVPRYTMTIDRLTSVVTTAPGTTLNILMELMSSTGRLPSTRIDGGEVATGTTASSKEITLSATRTLTAGTLYFLTFQCSASVTVATLASASPTLFMNTANAFVSGYQLTRSYGTLATWSGSTVYTANPVAIRVRKA